MDEFTLGNVTLELKEGDIASQNDIQAVVNAANARLKTGGGVAGAIHRAAGPGLEEEAGPLAPIKPGEAVITGAHNLPNNYVIHCLGPVYGKDKPEDQLLSDCYKNALDLAEEKGIESIAFPSISTGIFGYPMEDAARVAFATILQVSEYLTKVKLIRFVLHGKQAMQIHKKVMDQLIKPG